MLAIRLQYSCKRILPF